MGYKDHAINPDMQIRFYLKIQGLPYIFLSGDAPQTMGGTQFSAPTGYTLIENSLDASDIQDTGVQVSRLDGTAAPSSMLVRLLEDRSYTLGGLLAWDKTTGNLANLTASFPYETGSGPWTLTVDDTTGFSSSGVLHLGREAMSYSSKTATTFNVTERTKFDPVGYGSSVYRHNANLTTAPRVVADHPRVFIGRYVQLHAYWCNAEGYAVGTAFDDAESWEIYRGIIRELPRPGADWSSFEFEIESIDSILRTEVGISARMGNLSQSVVPIAKGLDTDTEVPPSAVYLITGATDRVHIVIESAGSVVYEATGLDALSVNGAAAVPPNAEVYTEQGLAAQFNDYISGAVQTGTGGAVSLFLFRNGNDWRLSAHNNTSGSTAYQVTVFCDAANSFFQLLGMAGTNSVEVLPGFTRLIAEATSELAAFVGKTATAIPFVFDPDSNLLTDIAPAEPGFCVIGKDEDAEIVSYQTISDLSSSTVAGLLQLNDCKRGLMGTAARDHTVTQDQVSQANNGPEIRFGLGVIDDPFLLTILNLAISTGDGNSGQYDLFAVGSGAPQAPGHFDDSSFLDASQDMTPTEQRISYFLSQPTKLSDLTRDWLTPPGRFIFPRVDDNGQYTIGIGRNKPPIPAQSVLTLDSSRMHWSDPASYARGSQDIVTGVTVFPLWDFAAEESADLKVSVINRDTESEFGQRNVIEWNLRGYAITPGAAVELVKNWAAQLQERHGRGRVVLELRADRSAWYVNVSDTVAITVPNIPTPDGGRGLTLRYGVVENIVKVYSGSEPGAILRVVVESSNQAGSYRPYAPSGKVASKSGSDITLTQNQYSESGRDAAQFAAGDEVIVHNEGDYASRETHTVVSVSGNVITLDGAVSLTVGNHTAIDLDDYADATTDQRLAAAFISNSSHEFSNGDEGHRYV